MKKEFAYGTSEVYNISREQYKSKLYQVCIARAMLRMKCFPVCAACKHNIHFARPRNIMSNNVSSFARAFAKRWSIKSVNPSASMLHQHSFMPPYILKGHAFQTE